MGTCLEVLGGQQGTVGTPSTQFPFQLPLGLWGRVAEIGIGASGQGASCSLPEGEVPSPQLTPLVSLESELWMLLIDFFTCTPEELALGTFF